MSKGFFSKAVPLVTILALAPGCRNDEPAGEGSDSSYYIRADQLRGDKARASAAKVEAALRAAGVCGLPVKTVTEVPSTPKIPVKSVDDVFSYFMLIANVESRLGEDGDGDGGVGMFGTNLDHVRDKVSSTHKGRTYRCQEGLVDNPVLNAECAFALYLQRGLQPWGQAGDDSWGSRRFFVGFSDDVIGLLRRSCSGGKSYNPACMKSKVRFGGTITAAMATTSSGGGPGNILIVDVVKECPATTVAVKLFADSAGNSASVETSDALSPPPKSGQVDLSWLKKDKSRYFYKKARVQLKHGADVLATLPLINLPQDHVD